MALSDTLNKELEAVSAKLVKNDDLLRGVLAGCGDCIKIFDLDGRLQFMSEGGRRVMEVEDFSVLKGCPWPDFWEGAGNADATLAIAAAKRGETARFRGPANTAKGTPRFWDVQVSPIVGADGVPTHILSISKDITEEHAAAENARQSSERQRFLMEELQHRVKNTLTMVLAIANNSFRGEANEEARAAFSNRIRILDQANEVLSRDVSATVQAREALEMAIRPHRTGEGRFSLDGPDVELTPQQALALTLAVNELATNAIKYGSLSVGGGKVGIRWAIDTAGGAPSFGFQWKEYGGPSIVPPVRKGFGTRIINSMLAAEFGGQVELTYEPTGVVCNLVAPLGRLPGSLADSA